MMTRSHWSLPVIAGVGQIVQRTDSAAAPLGPIELMIQAARRAAEDARSNRLLQRIEWLAAVGGVWPYRNPSEVIAQCLGSPKAATALSGTSGSAPQEAVGIAAARIARGDIDVALVVGGEARYSKRQLKKLGLDLPWSTADGTSEPERLTPLFHNVETDADQLGSIVPLYAVIEDSLRVSAGRSVPEHRRHIANLWERFSVVAAGNPMAWDQRRWTAAEILDDSSENRMIAFPYNKSLVANNFVDMASAVLVTSLEAAVSAGVPPDQLVFVHAVTCAEETPRLMHRRVLHETPALAAAGTRTLENTGITSADLTHIDLYACFPSIVQVSASSLGLPLGRPLTVTGGLGFAGAPLANASGQAIATMVPKLRLGGWGLVHANGGAATKHAFGTYGASPPATYQFERLTDLDLNPRDEIPDGWSGPVHIEAASVLYDRNGPTRALAAVISEERRRLVSTEDAAVIQEVITTGIGGETARLSSTGQLVV